MAQKVGVLGSGSVAQILAAGFLKHGYEVMMGSRDASNLKDFAAKNGGKIQVGSFSDAARFADIAVLAVKGSVAADVISLAGEENLAGKTVIDPTNPMGRIHFRQGKYLPGQHDRTRRCNVRN